MASERPFISLLADVTDKQGEAVDMIHVVMGQSWRHQCELRVSFIHMQVATSRRVYRCVCIQGPEYTHLPPGCGLRGPGSNDTLISNKHPAPKSWLLMPSLNKRDQGSLVKRLIPGRGQGTLRLSLEHLAVLKSKEVLRKEEIQEICVTSSRFAVNLKRL